MKNSLDSNALPPRGQALAVALSGGADSVALWDLLKQDGGWPLTAIHCQHGFRPQDQSAEEDLIRNLVSENPLVIVRAKDGELSHNVGLEESARKWRRQIFQTICKEKDIHWLALGHHADDQAETVLLNIFRGAGPMGMAGMPPKLALTAELTLVRPLLHLRRETLRRYNTERGLSWAEDPSNTDRRLRRNDFRHRVLPDLESACPGTIQELCDRAVIWQKRLENPSQIAIDAGYIGSEIWNADQDVFWPRFLKALERPIRRDSIVRLQDLAKGPSARSLRLGPWLLTRRGHGITWQRVEAV